MKINKHTSWSSLNANKTKTASRWKAGPGRGIIRGGNYRLHPLWPSSSPEVGGNSLCPSLGALQCGLQRPAPMAFNVYCPIAFPWPSPPYAAQPLSEGPPPIGQPNHPLPWLAVFASPNPSAVVLCLYRLSNFSATVLCPRGPSGLTDCLTTLCSSGLGPAPLYQLPRHCPTQCCCFHLIVEWRIYGWSIHSCSSTAYKSQLLGKETGSSSITLCSSRNKENKLLPKPFAFSPIPLCFALILQHHTGVSQKGSVIMDNP